MNSTIGQREAFVKNIFDRIAGRYDLLNRIISCHLDTVWRRELVRALELSGDGSYVLDLGTGTGDLALAACQAVGKRGRVLGLDLSWPMLAHAQTKTRTAKNGARSSYVWGSATAVPFADASFDAAISAFVLRNIPDLERFFTEAYRVLKPGGRIATLDMFPPPRGLFSCLYWLYFRGLMPWIGAGLAGDQRAYRYLADSVRNFAGPEILAERIQALGFHNVRTIRYLRGAICLHVGIKP